MFVAAIDPRVQRIEQLLDQLRLSHRWLAGKLGVTHTTIKNWLNGGGARDASLLDKAIRHLMAEQRARETLAESSVTLTPESPLAATGEEAFRP